MKYQNLLDRFITYVKVNTRSDENSTTTPSTQSMPKMSIHKLLRIMMGVSLPLVTLVSHSIQLILLI